MATVQNILDKKGHNVATIGPDETVLAAARLMNERRIGALVVVDAKGVRGIFTERDILTRIVAAQRDPGAARVSEAMTTSLVTCAAATPLAECRDTMTHRHIRHMPVIEDGRLIGIITSGDIMARESAEQLETIENLNHYMYEYK